MPIPSVWLTAALLLASQQTPAGSSQDAAPSPGGDTPVLAPAVPEDASTASSVGQVPPAEGQFTLDTPIRTLIADPRAKAVLDRDLPGLSEDSNLPKFEGLSLRRFQPLTGGQMTEDLLVKTGEDLAAITGESGPAEAADRRKGEPGR